ncbi:MAG: Mov34/MPN/PAD-1 family protein [Nanoarchaeota archaeon]|nr:Mov34/MPN/PAD-1 family protein [Nanoarchaeota archaeon]
MKKLEYILENNSKEKIDELFSDLKITDYAYKKIKAYASLACITANASIECGGYLVALKEDQDYIVKDVYLSKDQKVTGVEYIVDSEPDMDFLKEIKNDGYKVMGWWHSHGSMNPFHSGTDDDTFKSIYYNIFPYNKKESSREIIPLSGDSFKIEHQTDKTGNNYVFFKSNNFLEDVIEMKVGNNFKLNDIEVKEIKIKKFRGISFAYSLVVNRFYSAAPYAEVAIKHPKTKEIKINKGVKVTEIISNPMSLDYEKILDEIKTRIIYKGKFLGEITNKYAESGVI